MENKKRICPKCGLEKFYKDFNKSSSTVHGCTVYCKICCALKKKERYIKRTNRIDLKNKKIKSLESGYKKCNRCHEVKELNCFTKRKRNADGFSGQCNQCISNKEKERIQKYNEIRKDANIINKICEKCRVEKTIINFNTRKSFKDGYDNVCIDCRKIYQHDYYEKNSITLIKKKLDFLEYKRKTDLPYILKLRTRNLFRIRLSQLNHKKNKPFFKYTNISLDEYILFLQKDPLWQNYLNNEKIHLDHIIPMSIYDFGNGEDIKRCWNPNNLRLLFAEDNLYKSNKLDMDLIKKHNIEHLLPENFENKKGE